MRQLCIFPYEFLSEERITALRCILVTFTWRYFPQGSVIPNVIKHTRT